MCPDPELSRKRVLEDNHVFGVDQPPQKSRFVPSLEPVAEFRYETTVDKLPTIVEEFPMKPFVASLRGVPILLKNKTFTFKAPKEGNERFKEYRLSLGRRRKLVKTPLSKQTLFESVRSVMVQSRFAGLGVKSLYYDYYSQADKTRKVQRLASETIRTMMNLGKTIREAQDEYRIAYSNASIFKAGKDSDYYEPPGQGPLLYDCTIHRIRAKAFLDTGALNLPHNMDGTTSSAYVSKQWLESSGLESKPFGQPFDVAVANEQKVKCDRYVPGVVFKFGPHSERMDLFVFEGSDTFDIVLGRQWFKLRRGVVDHDDDSLIIPKGDDRLVKVPLTQGFRSVFKRGRYLNLLSVPLVPDSDETEVYHTWQAFERANKRSLEQHSNPQPLYCLKITKNILGQDVEIEKADPRVLAEFDNPDEDFAIGKSIDKYDAKVPKTQNVMHEFESIENVRTPLDDKPITNELMQEVWDEFGPDTKHPSGNLFPQEIESIDPTTGELAGYRVPPMINILPGHEHETPCRPVMKLPPDHEKELYTQIKYYLDKGWIVPSTSPYGCAVFFVPKKNGKLRIVLDYRALNSITKKDKFALPDPNHLTSQLAGAKYFSGIDLAHGYHQILLDESDRPKTAFRTLHGSYQWNVLTFGLTNAVPVFIKVMEQVLRQFIGVCCVIFIDDIIVYSKTYDQHKKDVFNVLQAIQEAKLRVNWAKSEFLLKEIKYLGHSISADGIAPLREKVKTVEDWPVPDNIYQIRSFLGAVGYYRKFIHNFSKWAQPLSDLTRDDPTRESINDKMVTMTKWGRNVRTKKLKPGEWTDECQRSFEHLKSALVSAPVLKIFDPDRSCEVMTDASSAAVGAVLMQRDDEDKLHPIAYFSQKLSSTEVNYPVHELELLAIFKALKHWRHYLINNETLVYTDHKPLKHLMDQSSLSLRQQRWITFLSDFKVEIIAVEGTKNIVADCLSRYAYASEALTEASVVIKGHLPAVMTEQNRDEHSRMSWVYSIMGFDQITCYAPYEEPCDAFWKPYARSSVGDEEPSLQDNPVHIKESLLEAYKSDTFCQRILSGVFEQMPHRYGERDGLVYYIDDDKREVLYIPPNAQASPRYQVTEHPVEGDEVRISVTLREELIREVHEGSGHGGVAKVYNSLRRYCYWPRMHKNVHNFIRGCHKCQSNKSPNRTVSSKLKGLQLPNRRWETVSMDWITRLPKTKSGFDSILVVVDYLSKRAHFIPTKDSSTSNDTARLFYDHVFRHHGMPSRIISDRDHRLTSGFWKTLTRLVGTHLAMSTPYHPQTDGATEVLNKTVAAMLRIFTENAYYDWDEYLTAAEFAYNNSLHRSTGYTPFELDTGQDPLDPISKSFSDLLRPDELKYPEFDKEAEALLSDWRDKIVFAKANLEDARQLIAMQDEHSYTDFKVGDKVWLNTKDLSFYDKRGKLRARSKFDPRYSGPYTIAEVIDRGHAFKLELGPKERFHPVQNVSKLLPYKSSSEFPLAHDFAPPVPVVATDEEGREEEELEVERILGKRRRGRGWQYRVRWKGYSRQHDSWEPKSNLTHCQEFIDDFEATLKFSF